MFLLDELLSNQDAKLQVSMRYELNRLHNEFPTTTVSVTHDQIEAMTLTSRVAVMNEGRIVLLGTPQDIYNDPQDMLRRLTSDPRKSTGSTARSVLRRLLART